MLWLNGEESQALKNAEHKLQVPGFLSGRGQSPRPLLGASFWFYVRKNSLYPSVLETSRIIDNISQSVTDSLPSLIQVQILAQ